MFLNYKLQATNYKQTTNHKLQITNKEVSLGQVLNAFGEEHKIESCHRKLPDEIFQAKFFSTGVVDTVDSETVFKDS